VADDLLILVDTDDAPRGFETKERCHDGEGLLHRAFSVFLFDAQGRLLLQQRSAEKRLWAGYWSNSCCSHPRQGESVETAAARRLAEELGVAAPLSYLFKFQYQARFGAAGSENELCYVFAGRLTSPARPNRDEIAATRLVSASELDLWMAAEPERFTPWFKLEWQRITREHLAVIGAVARET